MDINNIKVALILSGSVRNIEDTFKSMEYYLLNKFKNIDVFFYGCENVYGKDKNIEFLTEKFSPKKMVVNEKSFYSNFSDINKSIIAFYNVMMCNELKKEYEVENGFKYDLVIRTRMDLFWMKDISDNEIELALSGNILIPLKWAFRSGLPWNGPNPFGYSDFYAISNNELFNFYANAYKFLGDFTRLYPYHPESMLGYYLKDSPVIEVDEHVTCEYPIIQREGLDERHFHPVIWDGYKDFGTTDINYISALRKRLD